MRYTEADYLIAKLRGEIVEQEIIEYVEVQLISSATPMRVPSHITRIHAETCEEWLERMNS